MSQVGRNDPCPCGSGKKHKKCCLTREEANAQAAAGRVSEPPSPRELAARKLLGFAAAPEFQSAREAAEQLFFGGRLLGRSEAEVRSVLSMTQTEVNFNAWFHFDRELRDGLTLLDIFLERKGAGLTAGERDYLDRVGGTHLALYEIEAVEPDVGLTLADVFRGERVTVRERMATRQLVRWDLFAARVTRDPEGHLVLEGDGYLYPARAKAAIVSEIGRRYRSAARRAPGLDAAAFLKTHGWLFNHFWLDYVAFPPRPRVVTVEGDEVMPTRVIFEVRDREALVTALGRHPELVDDGEGVYVWGEEADEMRRTLGTFRVAAARLVLETMSKGRAERGRRLVEVAAGDAVRYRVTEYEDLGQAMKRAGRASRRSTGTAPSDAAIPRDVEAELLREFQDRHYRKWIDEPIPALGGRTPRAAARLKTWRPRLVDLLKEMENHEARAAREGRFAYDFGWVWEELELPRP